MWKVIKIRFSLAFLGQQTIKISANGLYIADVSSTFVKWTNGLSTPFAPSKISII